MSKKYSAAFKSRMVQKMLRGMTASAVSRETGVPQPTLSLWLREQRRVRDVSKTSSDIDDVPESPPRRPEDWQPEEKFQVVLESAPLSDDELGAFLRRKGLHEATLREWRQAMLGGLQPAPAKVKPSKKERALQRELHRKEKALAETTALLVLRKKLDALLEDEEDGSTGQSSDDESSS